jgi:hypothetical protein
LCPPEWEGKAPEELLTMPGEWDGAPPEGLKMLPDGSLVGYNADDPEKAIPMKRQRVLAEPEALREFLKRLGAEVSVKWKQTADIHRKKRNARAFEVESLNISTKIDWNSMTDDTCSPGTCSRSDR